MVMKKTVHLNRNIDVTKMCKVHSVSILSFWTELKIVQTNKNQTKHVTTLSTDKKFFSGLDSQK